MQYCPDYRQIDSFDCGDCCIRCYCARYKVSGIQLISNEHQGVSPDTMEAVLRNAGFNVLSGNLSVDDLKHYTKDRLVACPVTADDGVGHWVLVTAVIRNAVHLHDPADGPVKVKLADWLARWVDSTRAGTTYERFGVIAWL